MRCVLDCVQVFGGLTWCLVASTRVDPANPLGWVMSVSIFCFILTTVWFFIFLSGGNQSSWWPGLVITHTYTKHHLAFVIYFDLFSSKANRIVFVTMLRLFLNVCYQQHDYFSKLKLPLSNRNYMKYHEG